MFQFKEIVVHTLKSDTLEHTKRIANHGKTANGQETLGFVGSEVAHPAAPAGGQHHGLELGHAHCRQVEPKFRQKINVFTLLFSLWMRVRESTNILAATNSD